GFNIKEIIGGRHQFTPWIRRCRRPANHLPRGESCQNAAGFRRNLRYSDVRPPQPFPTPSGGSAKVLDRRQRRMAGGLGQSSERSKPQLTTIRSLFGAHGGKSVAFSVEPSVVGPDRVD